MSALASSLAITSLAHIVSHWITGKPCAITQFQHCWHTILSFTFPPFNYSMLSAGNAVSCWASRHHHLVLADARTPLHPRFVMILNFMASDPAVHSSSPHLQVKDVVDTDPWVEVGCCWLFWAMPAAFPMTRSHYRPGPVSHNKSIVNHLSRGISNSSLVRHIMKLFFI